MNSDYDCWQHGWYAWYLCISRLNQYRPLQLDVLIQSGTMLVAHLTGILSFHIIKANTIKWLTICGAVSLSWHSTQSSTNRPQKISRALGCHSSCSHTISDPNCQQRLILQRVWREQQKKKRINVFPGHDEKHRSKDNLYAWMSGVLYLLNAHTHTHGVDLHLTLQMNRGGAPASHYHPDSPLLKIDMMAIKGED